MLRIFFLSCLLITIVPVSYADSAASSGQPQDPSVYQRYTQIRKDVCAGNPLWKDYKEVSFLKYLDVPYVPAGTENAKSTYSQYLGQIGADASCLDQTGTTDVDRAHCAYSQTMDRLFSCARLYVQYHLAEKLQTIFPDETGSRKQFDQKTTQYHEQFSSDPACREPVAGGTLTVSPALLKNTTYQYCSYAYYLEYLNDTTSHALSADIKPSSDGATGTPQDTSISTNDALVRINLLKGQAAQSSGNANILMRDSLTAFGEWERAYDQHILFAFIEAKTKDISEDLRKVTGSWSQTLPKVPNAQAPEKPVGGW